MATIHVLSVSDLQHTGVADGPTGPAFTKPIILAGVMMSLCYAMTLHYHL